MHRKISNYLIKSLVLLCVVGFVGAMASKAEAEEDIFVKIKEAMAVMKADAAKLGEAKVDGNTLLFGPTKMNDNFPFVDALTTKFGCTATLFIKSGDGFIRITTNVMKEGKRAVGTSLDPKGAPIVAVKKGEAYYGIVDILGSQYSTGYEPIKNAAGEIVGVYYIGYQQEAGTIEF